MTLTSHVAQIRLAISTPEPSLGKNLPGGCVAQLPSAIHSLSTATSDSLKDVENLLAAPGRLAASGNASRFGKQRGTHSNLPVRPNGVTVRVRCCGLIGEAPRPPP